MGGGLSPGRGQDGQRLFRLICLLRLPPGSRKVSNFEILNEEKGGMLLKQFRRPEHGGGWVARDGRARIILGFIFSAPITKPSFLKRTPLKGEGEMHKGKHTFGLNCLLLLRLKGAPAVTGLFPTAHGLLSHICPEAARVCEHRAFLSFPPEKPI